MKRYLTLVAVLTLGLLFIVMLISGIGWAQGPGGDNPNSPWTSSAPISEGVQSQSPPDQPAGVGATDVEIAQSYNAFLHITGSALRPRGSDVEWRPGGEGGCIYAFSGAMGRVWNTPVYLPQGATVKYMRMYYDDTNASENSVAWFTVYDWSGTVVDEWEVASSGSAGNGFMTTSEFTHTVDYNNYSYVVNWRPNGLGTDMQVCGFRIYYHAPPGAVYLPLATKGAG